MPLPEIKKKVYPSSSGFMEGRTIYTDYDSGCLRSIGYKALGVQVPFDQKTAQVGATNEDLFEATLKGTEYDREKAISVDLGGGIVLSGRIDFVTADRLIELKSTRSTSKRTKLRAGTVTTENMAQIVAYMVATERTTAELRYTFYNDKKNTQEEYNFTVNIGAAGEIYLNGAIYRYDVYSYLAHRQRTVQLLSELAGGSDTALYAAGRPYRAADTFNSPCNYCPFRLACDKLDNRGPTKLETSLIDAVSSVKTIKGAS